jgi:lipopolysaccharide export system permease protein
MRLITRYVLREIGLVFLVTLVSLTALMILIGAVQQAVAQGLGLAQIVQLFPYLLPNALLFAVPGTILFAVSSVYGRMSSANEITALKSLGLSPMVVLWPALSLAVLLSLATVCLNDLAMSWGYHGVQRVVIDALEDIAYGTLRTQKSFGRGAFSVVVERVEGRKLINPFFSLPAQDGEGSVTARAEWAEIRSIPGSGKLTLELYNSTVEAPGHYAALPDEKFVYEVELVPQKGFGDSGPAHLALWQFPEATARQKELIAEHEQQMVANSGFQMLTGDFDGLSGGGWNDGAHRLQHLKWQLYRMQTEPPRRWANGFSCLCFALVGATMAIRMRNSDVLTSFFLCFGPILLVYYPLLITGTDRAKAGAINPYCVWLANVALVVWGLWLLRRVIRY